MIDFEKLNNYHHKKKLMALSDYRCCDICDCKVFYDANLAYEYVKDDGVLEGNNDRGSGYSLYNLGVWCVLCKDCSRDHCISIEKKG